LGRPPQHQPVPAPRDLAGFPHARHVKPKTSFAGSLRRPRWRDANNDILECDARHGRIERYNPRGDHLGEFSAETGEQLSAADPARKVTP